MPLVLPFAPASKPLQVEVEGVVSSRRTRFTYDILDGAHNVKGRLDGVEPGGTLRWSASASVKGTGSIPVRDVGQDIDWLNDRIRITAWTSDDGRPEVRTTLGIYLAAAPVETWEAGRRSWDVELVDRSSILDQDIMTTAQNGPLTYSVPAGRCVLWATKEIIADAGETAPLIAGDEGTKLTRDMTWDIGETRLRIINDLLDAGNFLSLWVNGDGEFMVSKADRPQDRPVLYEMWGPLIEGDRAVFAPDWSHDRDIYSIPNRLLAVEEGDGDDEGEAAIAVNMDPSSPYSFQSRHGRWVTEVVEGTSVTAAAGALQEWTERRLAQMTEVSSSLSVEHLFLPDLRPNAVIRFGAGDLDSILTRVESTEMTLDAASMVRTELREVVDIEGEGQ